MVGCIPPIRPLLVIVLRTIIGSSQRMTGMKHRERSNPLHSYHGSRDRTAKSKKGPSGLVSMLTGRQSDENIFAVEDGTIVKTTDIRLSYDRASGSHEPVTHGQVLPNERL